MIGTEINVDRVAAATGRRDQIVRYTKQIGNERYVTLLEIRRGRKRLMLATMWVEKIVGASPP